MFEEPERRWLLNALSFLSQTPFAEGIDGTQAMCVQFVVCLPYFWNKIEEEQPERIVSVVQVLALVRQELNRLSSPSGHFQH